MSPCEKGSYSEGGGLTPCNKCPAGFTTEAPGAGKALSDCLPVAGYDKDGTLCPTGKCAAHIHLGDCVHMRLLVSQQVCNGGLHRNIA